MDLGDTFDEMKDKVGKDKIDEGVDMAADKADDMTGNKYGDKIDKGADMAKDKLDDE